MDGALPGLHESQAVLGLTCGVLAVASPGLFAYVRLQPPVVIRVDQGGEASVVAGEAVTVRQGLLDNTEQASAKPGEGPAPSDVEGRAVVRRFLATYLTTRQRTSSASMPTRWA
ncbi:MAG: hypothetical protein R2762_15540 [Bryobacteraceae bacterium]